MVNIREMAPDEPVFKEIVVESCKRPLTAPTFRTVRELKREQTKRPPSIRYVEHVSDAFTYVTRHVDPVMSRVVSELLVHKPQNVALAMLEYFRWRASGSPALDDPSVMFRLKQGAEKTDRLYAVRHVTPLLSELMRELAIEQPKDLNAYVIDALTHKLKASVEKEAAPSDPSTAPPSTTKLPASSPAKGDTSVHPPTGPTGAGDTTLPSEATSPPPAPFVKAFNVLLLGLNGVGKSSLLATLKGDLNPCPQPTIGFRFAKMMTDGGTRVTFYDLGGAQDPRRLWVNYYHDVHGVIFVLDGAQGERWQESLDLLHATLAHKFLVDKPLLVLLSKQDQPHARSPQSLQQELPLDFVSPQARREDVRVEGAVLNASKNGDVIDPRLETSLQWLFERVRQGFSHIDARVQRDSAEAKEEFARADALKDRERLRNFIHKACLDADAGGSDCFTPQEGLSFLCEEIGVEAKDLPEVAKDVASGVGYQKHALQMVGNMKNPIAHGKEALEWDEIWQRVASLRTELGLPEKAPARE